MNIVKKIKKLLFFTCTAKKELCSSKVKILILAGEKEQKEISQSTQQLKQKISKKISISKCIVFSELYHGQSSILQKNKRTDLEISNYSLII